MIQFREICLCDKTMIDALLIGGEGSMCDHTFTNLYAWQTTYHTAWAEVCGALVVRFDLSGEGDFGYMIVGGAQLEEIFSRLKSHVDARGERLHIVCADRAIVESFKAWAERGFSVAMWHGEKCFAVCDNLDNQDYIYSVEALATLPGSRYKPKRNHVNKFESKYRWSVEPLAPQHFEECLRLECRWQQRKAADTGEVVDCRESDEQGAIRRVFGAWSELDAEGLVLKVEDKVVAFTYGSAISKTMFCTHTEKADSAYEGAFPMINREFARTLLTRGYELVNREEDMGLAGLRRAKEQYNPVRKQERMSLKLLSARELQCRDLWQRVFGDSREFIDIFLTDGFRPENLFCREAEGRVVSMAFVVELQTDYGPTGYLYAVATDSNWRGRGFAQGVVREAIEEMRHRGYRAAMLIPSHPKLKEFYAPLGFMDVEYPLDFSDGFDLGTGNPACDRAMVLDLR